MGWEEKLLTASRFILRAVALILGSLSILFLWISFYDPPGASFALVFLATATGITLALPQPPLVRSGKRS
jgi:hypothetical protein